MRGAVRSYRLLNDGRRQIGAFHLAGDIFGLESGPSHRLTAEAIVETTVRMVKRRSLEAAAKSDVAVACKLWAMTAGELRHAEDHMLLLGRKTAAQRVATFLLEMDKRLAVTGQFALPMSRCDIADYLGLTLETVSRTCRSSTTRACSRSPAPGKSACATAPASRRWTPEANASRRLPPARRIPCDLSPRDAAPRRLARRRADRIACARDGSRRGADRRAGGRSWTLSNEPKQFCCLLRRRNGRRSRANRATPPIFSPTMSPSSPPFRRLAASSAAWSAEACASASAPSSLLRSFPTRWRLSSSMCLRLSPMRSRRPSAGRKSQPSALKLVVYSMTPVWVAGVFSLIPSLGILILVGVIYSLYLVWVGAPAMMKTPSDRAAPYTAVMAVCGIVIYFIVLLVVAKILGVAR